MTLLFAAVSDGTKVLFSSSGVRSYVLSEWLCRAKCCIHLSRISLTSARIAESRTQLVLVNVAHNVLVQ